MATCCVKKDREEARNYAVDFQLALDAGDALTGTPNVEVTRRLRSGKYEDKSSEFGSLNAVIYSTQVQFQLGAGGTGEQSPGRFWIRVTVDTQAGETLVETVELEVTGEGDTDIP